MRLGRRKLVLASGAAGLESHPVTSRRNFCRREPTNIVRVSTNASCLPPKGNFVHRSVRFHPISFLSALGFTVVVCEVGSL